MATCEHFQSQLLAHLYDLVEPDEGEELHAHLDQCVACQAALVHARDQKRLLATAAKSEFAGVTFHAPQELVPAQEEAPVLRTVRVGALDRVGDGGQYPRPGGLRRSRRLVDDDLLARATTAEGQKRPITTLRSPLLISASGNTPTPSTER